MSCWFWACQEFELFLQKTNEILEIPILQIGLAVSSCQYLSFVHFTALFMYRAYPGDNYGHGLLQWKSSDGSCKNAFWLRVKSAWPQRNMHLTFWRQNVQARMQQRVNISIAASSIKIPFSCWGTGKSHSISSLGRTPKTHKTSHICCHGIML